MPTTGHHTLREQSLDFLRSGYLFTSRVRQRAGLPADSQTPVSLRLMGRRAVLLRGVEGVRHFYDTDKVKREGAMPAFVRLPLF